MQPPAGNTPVAAGRGSTAEHARDSAMRRVVQAASCMAMLGTPSHFGWSFSATQRRRPGGAGLGPPTLLVHQTLCCDLLRDVLCCRPTDGPPLHPTPGVASVVNWTFTNTVLCSAVPCCAVPCRAVLCCAKSRCGQRGELDLQRCPQRPQRHVRPGPGLPVAQRQAQRRRGLARWVGPRSVPAGPFALHPCSTFLG